MTSPEELLAVVAEGKSYEQWIADPCFDGVFGELERHLVEQMREVSINDPAGLLAVKQVLYALDLVKAGASEFVRRGDWAAMKLKELRKREERKARERR